MSTSPGTPTSRSARASINIHEKEVLADGKKVVFYRVELETDRGIYQIKRRYNDFAKLHKALKARGMVVPGSFPPKKLFHSAKVLNRRMIAFQTYIAVLISIPDIFEYEEVREFFDVSVLAAAPGTLRRKTMGPEERAAVRASMKHSTSQNPFDLQAIEAACSDLNIPTAVAPTGASIAERSAALGVNNAPASKPPPTRPPRPDRPARNDGAKAAGAAVAVAGGAGAVAVAAAAGDGNDTPSENSSAYLVPMPSVSTLEAGSTDDEAETMPIDDDGDDECGGGVAAARVSAVGGAAGGDGGDGGGDGGSSSGSVSCGEDSAEMDYSAIAALVGDEGGATAPGPDEHWSPVAAGWSSVVVPSDADVNGMLTLVRTAASVQGWRNAGHAVSEEYAKFGPVRRVGEARAMLATGGSGLPVGLRADLVVFLKEVLRNPPLSEGSVVAPGAADGAAVGDSLTPSAAASPSDAVVVSTLAADSFCKYGASLLVVLTRLTNACKAKDTATFRGDLRLLVDCATAFIDAAAEVHDALLDGYVMRGATGAVLVAAKAPLLVGDGWSGMTTAVSGLTGYVEACLDDLALAMGLSDTGRGSGSLLVLNGGSGAGVVFDPSRLSRVRLFQSL